LKDEFFFNFSLEHYKIAHDIFQAIDDKIKNLLGIIMAIFPIVIGIGYYLLSTFNMMSFLLFSFSLLSLLASAFVGFLALFPTKIGLINTYTFYNDHYDEELDDIKESAAVTISFLTEHMIKEGDKKSTMLKYMLAFLLVNNLLLLITFVVLFFKL